MRKNKFLLLTIVLFLCVVFCASSADAAHPLITDDTGVQGKGKMQIELNGEYASDRETNASDEEIVTRDAEAAVSFTYGISDSIDGVIGVPYVWSEIHDSASTHESAKGISDMSVEVKWRFFEKEGFSLGLKPGMSIPTGDDEKGLGTGKYGFSAYFIATYEAGQWAFHANLGYIRNNNKDDERKNLSHASLASELAITENLKAVVNVGIDRNPDCTSDKDPVFLIGGLIFALSEDFEIDAGIKKGMTDPEADTTALAGMTARF